MGKWGKGLFTQVFHPHRRQLSQRMTSQALGNTGGLQSGRSLSSPDCVTQGKRPALSVPPSPCDIPFLRVAARTVMRRNYSEPRQHRNADLYSST